MLYHPHVRRCPSCQTEYDNSIAFCGRDGTITIQVQSDGEHDARLGSQLGDYVIVAHVADGAMGRVYEARHPESRQRVAIKVLHDQVATDTVAVERFKREYETAEEMDHPHVVDVIDFGETPDGSYFMTMEYLQGEELGELLRRDGAQPPERTLRVISQLCAGLDHAHSFGVIHRDLKPDNVFLCESPEGDRVKILDFGSVKLQMETGPKLTAFGTTLGSPYYMSPEQAMGKLDVDQRTDVFAAAAIAWEMAVGKVAFEGDNVAQILMKIVNHTPQPPSQLATAGVYPPAFDEVVLRGVAKEKGERQASAGSLADALVAAFGLSGGAARWSQAPSAELADALARATPPPPSDGFTSQAPESFSRSPMSSGAALVAGPSQRRRQGTPYPSSPRVDYTPSEPASGGGATGVILAMVAILVLLGGGLAFFLLF